MQYLIKLLFPFFLFLSLFFLTLFHESFFEKFSEPIINQILFFSQYLLGILMWLSGAWSLTRFLNLLFWPFFVEQYIGTKVPKILKDFISVIIFSLCISGIIASVFEQSVSGILAASGLLGLVVGFAVKGIISDFFSGIVLNLNSPYGVNDWVELDDGEKVQVLEINWRSTVFKTFFDNIVIIPNSKMSSMKIKNYNRPNEIFYDDIEISVDFEIPVDRVENILLSATKEGMFESKSELRSHNYLSVEPIVTISEINFKGITYNIYYPVPGYVSTPHIKKIVFSKVTKHLSQAGIKVSYPRVRKDIFSLSPAEREPSRKMDKYKILSYIDFFSVLNDQEIEKIVKSLKEVKVLSLESIFVQGESGDSMYFIIEGLVSLYIKFDGKEEKKLITKLGAGSFFGEMSLLTGEKRSATITADNDTYCYKFSKETIEEILFNRPVLFDAISKIMAQRKLTNKEKFLEMDKKVEQKIFSFSEKLKSKMKKFFGFLS